MQIRSCRPPRRRRTSDQQATIVNHTIREVEHRTSSCLLHRPSLLQEQLRTESRGRNHTSKTRTGRCFVCNKEDCRSWNYTEKELDEAKTRFKAKLPERLRKSRFLPRHVKQYITEVECDTEDDEEWEDTFNTLALDVESSEDVESTEHTIYITWRDQHRRCCAHSS